MAPSIYDDSFLSENEREKIRGFQDAYKRAQAQGDSAGMEAAHAAAERVRASRGYSGGADGYGYRELSGAGETYRPSVMPRYSAQIDAVNSAYDAAREAQIAGLKSAYDASLGALNAQRQAIPEIYQDEKNDLAAQAQISDRNFNEYAAATGINSGAAGQAALARSNQLQGDMAELGRQEASAIRDVDSAAAQLKARYQDSIAQAVAEGEYKRASAILDEYIRAAQSAVDAARDQADEDYRAWQANVSRR